MWPQVLRYARGRKGHPGGGASVDYRLPKRHEAHPPQLEVISSNSLGVGNARKYAYGSADPIVA